MRLRIIIASYADGLQNRVRQPKRSATYPADLRLAKMGIVGLLFTGEGPGIRVVNATRLRRYSDRTK